MIRTFITAVVSAALLIPAVTAQTSRPLSPRGTATVHVQGKYVKTGRGQAYEGGKWIEISYGRPIKRGRDLWGAGAEYGRGLLAGAPIWRAGADVTTRLMTETPLVIGGKTVPAGEYSLFIDVKENNWTFVVSTWTALEKYDPKDKTALWGAYGYTPDKDVLRTPMKLETLPNSIEQLTWQFIDMTESGGTLSIAWDKVRASVPFTFGK